MPSVLIQTQQTCEAGDHLDVASFVDGMQTGYFHFQISELTEPLLPGEVQDAVKTLVRFYAQGLTDEQVKAALSTGYEVTI